MVPTSSERDRESVCVSEHGALCVKSEGILLHPPGRKWESTAKILFFCEKELFPGGLEQVPFPLRIGIISCVQEE